MKSSVADKDGVRHLLLCRVILGRAELVHPGTEQCYPSSEDFDSGVDNFSAPKKYIIWSSRVNTHVLPAYVVSFRVPSLKGLKALHVFLVLLWCSVNFVIRVEGCSSMNLLKMASFFFVNFVGTEKNEEPLRPSSPWMPFPTLISVLSKVLPSPDIVLISKFHEDHKVSDVGLEICWFFFSSFKTIVLTTLFLQKKKISRHELIHKVRQIAGDKLLIAAIKSYRAKVQFFSFR